MKAKERKKSRASRRMSSTACVAVQRARRGKMGIPGARYDDAGYNKVHH